MAREPARSFEDLVVWQKAHALVLGVYRLSKRRGRADKARLMNVAEGSLEETRYYLRLAQDLGYRSNAELIASAGEVGRLLGAYVRNLLSAPS